MAASPRFKVYKGSEYIASCKYADDAAALCRADIYTIRDGHTRIVWDEGNEEFSAGESYDGVAEVVYSRTRRIRT